MIIERTPLSMNSLQEVIKNISDSEKKQEIELFLKKFLETSEERAKKIQDGIEKLDLIKVKEEHIIKIIDILPADSSDVNKIFIDASLSEEEINKILEVVKSSK